MGRRYGISGIIAQSQVMQNIFIGKLLSLIQSALRFGNFQMLTLSMIKIHTKTEYQSEDQAGQFI